ncbi:ATP-binding cassette domain-containing protein [Thalassobaculum sp.]|uniref:phosphonate ABC transporter ATP-binding protein n=1 Tax=Thalassobaculum sp. TaxID=2022740 RepID=UPI0032ED5528
MALALAEDTAADMAVAGQPAAVDACVDLAVRGLTKRFGTRPVLRGVDLAVPRGQAVALIGSNGAGKSTLLRCCLRLIEPDGGEATLLGESVQGLGRGGLRRLRSRIGFVFQRHNLVGRLSALSNVLHGAQARHAGPRYWLQSLAPAAARDEAMHCLDRVGLAELAPLRADRLSGGQSQRVAIARALMQRPAMVVADEPVASLDPAAGEEVMAVFVRLIREEGATLVFTSHNLEHALAHADRVVALKDGAIVLDRPAAELTPRDLGFVYG